MMADAFQFISIFWISWKDRFILERQNIPGAFKPEKLLRASGSHKEKALKSGPLGFIF